MDSRQSRLTHEQIDILMARPQRSGQRQFSPEEWAAILDYLCPILLYLTRREVRRYQLGDAKKPCRFADALAQAHLAAWTAVRRYKREWKGRSVRLTTWVNYVASSSLRRWLGEEERAHARSTEDGAGEIPAAEITTGAFEAKERCKQILDWLIETGQDDAVELIVLRMEGQTLVDIANALNKPVGTVKSDMSRLFNRIRERFPNDR